MEPRQEDIASGLVPHEHRTSTVTSVTAIVGAGNAHRSVVGGVIEYLDKHVELNRYAVGGFWRRGGAGSGRGVKTFEAEGR